jgi:hypothetical protein
VFGFFLSPRAGELRTGRNKNGEKDLEEMADVNLNANQKLFRGGCGIILLGPPKKKYFGPAWHSLCTPASAKHRQARLPSADATSTSTSPLYLLHHPFHHQPPKGNNKSSKNAPRRRNHRAPQSLPLVQHRKDNRRGDHKIEHDRNTAVHRRHDRDGVGADW